MSQTPLLIIGREAAAALRLAKELGRPIGKITPNRDDAWGFLADHPSAQVIWDIDDEDLAGPFGKLLPQACPPERIFAWGAKEIHEYPHLFESDAFGHFVSHRGAPLRTCARMFDVTPSQPEWGLKEFFGAGVQSQELILKNSGEKEAAVEAIQNFLRKIKVGERLSTLAAQAADELLMNAIFDAPIDSPEGQAPGIQHRRYRRHYERDAQFALSERERVSLRISSNDTYVGIAVTDRFGSLYREALLRFLRKNYEKGQYTVWKNDPGAGLGVYNMARSGLSLRFVCVEGKYTEVQIYFPRSSGFKQFRESARFISFMLPRGSAIGA